MTNIQLVEGSSYLSGWNIDLASAMGPTFRNFIGSFGATNVSIRPRATNEDLPNFVVASGPWNTVVSFKWTKPTQNQGIDGLSWITSTGGSAISVTSAVFLAIFGVTAFLLWKGR